MVYMMLVPVLFCGAMCSLMCVDYWVTGDQRARRLAFRWMIHTLFIACNYAVFWWAVRG